MRRAIRILGRLLLAAILTVAPTVGVLCGLGFARPRFFQHAGHEFHALRFDGPRIQYWNGRYFAVESDPATTHYAPREVRPDWDEQYRPSPNRTRHPTGSFARFDGSPIGFTFDPWWPVVATPMTLSISDGVRVSRADGTTAMLRSGPTLTIRTVKSWFVLLVASIPWLAVGTRFVATRLRVQRRRDAGRCRHCGYDLRASPERCPECGASA